jgi:argininosuccinate lyase
MRGRSGAAIGSLVQSLTLLKGLPISGSADFRENRKCIVSAFEAVRVQLDLAKALILGMEFNKESMEAAAADIPYAWTGDLVDIQAHDGFPLDFAEYQARELTDYLVKNNKSYKDLTVEDLTRLVKMKSQESAFSDLTNYDHFTIRRSSIHAVLPENVTERIRQAAIALKDDYAIYWRDSARALEMYWKGLRGGDPPPAGAKGKDGKKDG